jgi:hypothetical protein
MSNKPIPQSPLARLLAAMVSRTRNSLFGRVRECVEAQDLLILAGQSDKKSLDWVLVALSTPESEVMAKQKTIETACRVFDGILKALENEEKAASAQPEIDAASRYAEEILRWGQGGWETVLRGFAREMRGIHPNTLTEHLGFDESQVSLSSGEPQWGIISLYDVAVKVMSDETVLTNRAFRRTALTGFAAFFRYAFGQTGSEDSELLDWSDEISVLLYGADAKLAVRQGGTTTPKQVAQTKTTRKPESKVKAQQRGKAHAEKKAQDPTRKRGYESA